MNYLLQSNYALKIYIYIIPLLSWLSQYLNFEEYFGLVDELRANCLQMKDIYYELQYSGTLTMLS